MNKNINKSKLVPFLMLITLTAVLLFVNGCTRYARTVDPLYEPSTPVRGGNGEVYIVIPENRQTQTSGIKWVLGKVKDDKNKTIDEVYSSRSQAETIQAALGLELRKAGYSVLVVTKNPGVKPQVIDLVKTEIELEQISDFADLKAKCRVVAGMDISKNGQMVKRLQYEATSSRRDIKDREILAGKVLKEALQSIMLKAMPDLHGLFTH